VSDQRTDFFRVSGKNKTIQFITEGRAIVTVIAITGYLKKSFCQSISSIISLVCRNWKLQEGYHFPAISQITVLGFTGMKEYCRRSRTAEGSGYVLSNLPDFAHSAYNELTI